MSLSIYFNYLGPKFLGVPQCELTSNDIYSVFCLNQSASLFSLFSTNELYIDIKVAVVN
jgi:hypothetical protein